MKLVYDTLECAEAMLQACSLEPRHSPDALFPQNGSPDVTNHGHANGDTATVDVAAVVKVGTISNSPTHPPNHPVVFNVPVKPERSREPSNDVLKNASNDPNGPVIDRDAPEAPTD